jgi:hypothetical protein
MSADFMPVTSMSDEELLKYAQMRLDIKEPMPLEWQQELLKRFAETLDAELASYT